METTILQDKALSVLPLTITNNHALATTTADFAEDVPPSTYNQSAMMSVPASQSGPQTKSPEERDKKELNRVFRRRFPSFNCSKEDMDYGLDSGDSRI